MDFIGSALLAFLALLLAVSGIVLSAIDVSGTWLVASAALVLRFAYPENALSPPAILLAFALCAAVDILEFFATRWGVVRRGGSPRAGCAAFLGTILGSFLGAWLLPPPVGALIGMFACAFLLVYLVERPRWKDSDPSRPAHIARGALLATAVAWGLKLALSIVLAIAVMAAALHG